MIVFIVAFLLGACVGAAVLWRVLPARLKLHTDYKQRWEEAIGLLGSEGRLTSEQVSTITGSREHKPAALHDSTLRVLHSMATWDRRDAEIARAKKGLPPLDDLAGMATWDQAAVLKARAKGEQVKREGEEV